MLQCLFCDTAARKRKYKYPLVNTSSKFNTYFTFEFCKSMKEDVGEGTVSILNRFPITFLNRFPITVKRRPAIVAFARLRN